MKTTNNRRTQSYRRVSNWGKEHDALLQTAPAVVHTFFTSLDGVINRIEVNAATQDAEHVKRTRKATDADQLRNAVRDAMRPISQTARALRGSVFGISAIPLMPGANADNEHLYNAANSMVQNATVMKSTLIDHGLAPDCIETLAAAAAALKSSIDARGAALSRALGAKKGLGADIQEGRKLVSLLDSALSAMLKDDPKNLASWKNAKRVTVKGARVPEPVTLTAAPSGTTAATAGAVSTTPAATAAVTTTPSIAPQVAPLPKAA